MLKSITGFILSLFIILSIQSCLSTDRRGDKEDEQSDSVEEQEDNGLQEVLLTSDEVSEKIQKLLPDSITPVCAEGRMLVFFEDLNSDDFPEFLVLGVETGERLNGDVFSDFSGLFAEDIRPYPFYLYIFYQKEREVHESSSYYLGKRYIYGNFTRLPVNKKNTAPFIICITFQAANGAEKQFLAFQGDDYNVLSSIGFKDNITSKVFITDLDEDENIDILIEERGAQEGTGFETYLLWYKWKNTGFTRYAQTNIVQNLKKYLDQVKNFLLEREWIKLGELCFQPDRIRYLRGRGYKYADMVMNGLKLNILNPENKPAAEVLSSINEIIFPQFLENPFIIYDDRGYHFALSFRVTDNNDLSYVSEALVYMNKNPFDKQQFFFDL